MVISVPRAGRKPYGWPFLKASNLSLDTVNGIKGVIISPWTMNKQKYLGMIYGFFNKNNNVIFMWIRKIILFAQLKCITVNRI